MKDQPLHPLKNYPNLVFLCNHEGCSFYRDDGTKSTGFFYIMTGEEPDRGWIVNGRYHPDYEGETRNFPTRFRDFIVAYNNLMS